MSEKVTPSLDSVTTIRDDGSRRFIHPASVSGRFTRMRTVADLLLMAVYVLLPWIPINGHPAVFLDVAERRFHLFGLTFVTQDLWLAFFVITGLGFSLFYITALFGRIWCGWACPQTVFLDIVRRVERWIEGDAPARRRLDDIPWTGEKTLKRGATLVFFGLFAFVVAHVFLAYFVSIPKLYEWMRHSPREHWAAFVFVFAMTAALWFNFAWFREQFCIIMCPYGRIQSALTDDNTLIIGYDEKRGEPRGKKGTPGAGDCIDCRRCVQVCPTGIDIRQGLQLECIGCSACVDACDAVMQKIERPRGLIRYDSFNGLRRLPRKFIRPRVIAYTFLLLLGAAVMTYSFSTFKPATITLVRMTGAPYFLEGDRVRNQFLVRVINKRDEPAAFRMEVADAPPEVTVSGIESAFVVDPLGEKLTPVVLTYPRAKMGPGHGEFPFRIRVVAEDGSLSLERTATFLGPGHGM
jgi:cytochrome c oxidase accessory protein FixG